ncbi:hypothetical protein M1N90_02590 [Dehalococcoidia bacterium]|nr:hypothetical protein [Dehalococcoidia bacterium]
MKFLIRATFLFAILFSFALTAGTARADASDTVNQRITVIAIDDFHAVSNESVSNAIYSVHAVVSNFKSNDTLYLSFMSDPKTIFGPYRGPGHDFNQLKSVLENGLSDDISASQLDLAEVVTNTYNLLATEGAPAGSGVHLLGGSDISITSEDSAKFLDPLSDIFNTNNWEITGIQLPSATDSMKSLLKNISERSGNNVFDLSSIGGLKEFADHIMTEDNLGSLQAAGSDELKSDDTLTTRISVAPGTEKITMAFFKDSTEGSLKLKTPNGEEISINDAEFYDNLESPNLTFWNLTNPIPGNWTVDISGISGQFSSWHVASNKYSLNLNIGETVPTDQPASIIAYVADGETMIIPEDGAIIEATVTGPSGTSVIYQLNDTGIEGDVTSGDGYFSTTIPALTNSGEYMASLELKWTDSAYSLKQTALFEAQPFPKLEVTFNNLDRLRPSERSNIATIYTNIEGQPYAVDPSSIEISILDNQIEGNFELIPRESTADGRGWMFDVMFTPESDGISSISFSMALLYGGISHTDRIDAATLIVEKIQMVTLKTNSEKPVPSTTITPPVPSTEITIPPQTIAIGVIGIPVAIVALVIAGIIYIKAQPTPYGTMKNELGEIIVDFKSLKRSFIAKILFPSKVRGKETKVTELRGITFKFGREGVEIQSLNVSPTVRLNNEPIVGDAKLDDESWIGSQGKLFSFLSSGKLLRA